MIVRKFFSLVLLIAFGYISCFQLQGRSTLGTQKVGIFVHRPTLAISQLLACRRNNKEEKRKRNLLYAMKHRSKDGISRRRRVQLEQRAAERAKQESWGPLLFQHTTDADFPPFVDFDK